MPLGFLKDIFGGGAGKLVDSIGGVLDDVITSKEERAQLDNEIKKAEMDFQREMAQMSLQEKQAFLADVSSARNREIEVNKSENASFLSKNAAPILGLVTCTITFTLFYLVIFNPEKIENTKEVVMYILGVLSAILAQIFSYYFGSSQGSADKSRTISNELRKSTVLKPAEE